MNKIIIKLIIFSFFTCTIYSQSLKDLNIGVNVDQVFKSDFEKDDHDYMPREAEVSFYGPINHQFDALISAAAHEEGGEYNFELHEAWLSSSSLIKNFDLKLGQFFLGIGRLNRFHRHEWPTIFAPNYHVEFFDEEGVADSGLEFTYRFPIDINLTLVGGIGSGRTFGHTHSAGSQPNLPTNYFRLSNYSEIFGWNGMDFGLNYLNRINSEGDQTILLGFDYVAKKKDRAVLKHFIQFEFWFRNTSFENDDDDNHEIGHYLLYQYGFDKTWYLASRVEYYSDLSREDIFGDTIDHFDIRGLLSLTYQASENLRFKLEYTHGIERQDNEEIEAYNSIALQITFLLGAHPSHEF